MWIRLVLVVGVVGFASGVSAQERAAENGARDQVTRFDLEGEFGGRLVPFRTPHQARFRVRAGLIHVRQNDTEKWYLAAGGTLALDTSNTFGAGVQIAAGSGFLFLASVGVEHWTNNANTLTVGLGTALLALQYEHTISGPFVARNSLFLMLMFPFGLVN